MTPARTEGPYFVDENLNSDVTAGSDGTSVQPGTPLTLTMYVFDADRDCALVSGAQLDIWHANAAGNRLRGYPSGGPSTSLGVDHDLGRGVLERREVLVHARDPPL